MKRILSWVTILLVFISQIAMGPSLVVWAAVNVTPSCGAIGINTTWTVAASPYEVCTAGTTVSPGVSLTIQPGVTVQFQASARLVVSGALAASGTPDKPVTFTSLTTTPGSWVGIQADGTLANPAQVSLKYATLRFGGVNSLLGAQVVADHAVITVTHSLLENGAGSGIYATSNTSLDVEDAHFNANGGSAMRLIQPTSRLNLSALSATGNGLNGIYVGGTTYLHGLRSWSASGLPYLVDGILGNFAGDELTIDPGSVLQFTPQGFLNIGGDLIAHGTPTAPITLTAQTKTPGAWNGLVLFGGQTPANAQLDYVTLEYGGRDNNGANITVDSGYLVAHHTTIRNSQRDGVRINANGHASLLESLIVSNTLYGVRNTQTTRSILATNDWWGNPSGPTSDVTACSPGTGDRVTAGVLFRPVLTDTNITRHIPLSDAPQLTLTPERWFAPADGFTKIIFDITLRDGNGAPMPGRQVRISSSSGIPTDGGLTGADGKTLASLVSSSVGDAEVTATLDAVTSCEGAMSPTTRVSFTAPVNITDLFPNSPASYFDGNIGISPLPVIVGVPAVMSVRLTNPLTLPITVDATFGFVQTSIGLAFGPIQNFQSQVIPAKSSVTLSAVWLPQVSGHFCVEASYTIIAVGAARLQPQAGGVQKKQRNIESKFGSVASWLYKIEVEQLTNVYKEVSSWHPAAAVAAGLSRYFVLEAWQWVTDKLTDETETWSNDPPRQDYTQISLPVSYTYPLVTPDATVSQRRADAANALSADLVNIMSNAEAAVIAIDRYGGASEAQNLTWAALQANARNFYQKQMAQALLSYANDLDNFVQVLNDEGIASINISATDMINYQQRLITQGFTADEIAQAKAFGLTDADIEAHRQFIIKLDPYQAAGDVLTRYKDKAALSRLVAQALLTPYTFEPQHIVGGSPGLNPVAATTGNSLAQVNNTVTTFILANPLNHTALIDLRTRRIDLPADWTASVSPAQVSLAPGQQITVTATVLTGSPVAQNSIPRLAVEAYAGSELLGGVVVDIVVPHYTLFDGKLHLYLPKVAR